MFNKYVLKNNPTSYCTKNVKVHEHRAPTDDSIKLLNEMQEKTRQNIVDNFQITDNDLNGNVIIFEDPCHLDFKVYVNFRLNGKLYKFNESISQQDKMLFNAKEKLIECMTRAIYENLVKGMAATERGDWMSEVTR